MHQVENVLLAILYGFIMKFIFLVVYVYLSFDTCMEGLSISFGYLAI